VPLDVNANGGRELLDEVELANAAQSSSSSAPSSRASAWSSLGESLQHGSFVQRGLVPAWVFLVLMTSHWFLAGWAIYGAMLHRESAGNNCDALLRNYSLLIVIIGLVGYLLILASTIGVGVVKCTESCCRRELPRRYTANSSEPDSSVGS
jgi:hypothetical protein